MKNLIRLFIAIFCVFFLLRAMPGSVMPILRSFLDKSAQTVSDLTLDLAEEIDSVTGNETDRRDPETGEDSADPAEGASEKNSGDSSGEAPGEEVPPEDGAGQEDDAEIEDPDSGGQESEGESGAEESEGESGGQAGEQTGEDIFYFYYTKLSQEERLLYDAMLALASDPDAGPDAEESRLLGLDPASDGFAESYTRAYNALVTDHPELFWIAQGRAKYECRYYRLPSFGGKYKIVLSLADASGQDGEGDGALRAVCRMYQGEEEELKEAADALLDQVDLTQPDAVIALRLHDLLIDNAWYNVEAGADDYAHTAYGALVRDSDGNPGGALCDGYALAYEYLLQRAGLTCTMVCGYAGASEEDTEKHAWNLVLLDGDWYEVDATWDDLDFLLSPSDSGYDLLLEALSDEAYMQRVRHYMFNLTTEQIRSFTPGEEYRYTSYNGWVTLLQSSVHIRFSAEESEWTRDYITPLAPVAEGTWYTWETVEGM